MKNSKLKFILFKKPEYYFIILSLLAGYTPPLSFHILSIVLAGLVILQIIYKNSNSGSLIGISFVLANLYILAALISELLAFPVFNKDAAQLLFIGLSIWILNMLFSAGMIYKYRRKNKENNDLSIHYTTL